jgi:hypothetical protein
MMGDKDQEIQELKDRLNKIEVEKSQNLKKDSEKKRIGCFGWLFLIIVFLFIFSFFNNSGDSETTTYSSPKEDTFKNDREKILSLLTDQGLTAYWGQDISLWIENPGSNKAELERFGYELCDATKSAGISNDYIITFWQSLRNGPSGQIAKVKCF